MCGENPLGGAHNSPQLYKAITTTMDSFMSQILSQASATSVKVISDNAAFSNQTRISRRRPRSLSPSRWEDVSSRKSSSMPPKAPQRNVDAPRMPQRSSPSMPRRTIDGENYSKVLETSFNRVALPKDSQVCQKKVGAASA